MVLCFCVVVACIACGEASDGTNTIESNTNVDFTSGTSKSGTPAPQTIKFESADKVEIIGTYYESEKSGSAAVLLLHQFGSDRKSYRDFALIMQAKGIAVLAIDGRGFGESVKTTDGKSVGPSRTDESVKGMLADVDAGFAFLAKQELIDKSRIGIVGASYGSSLAILYAAEHENVKTVVLLSPGLNYFGNMPTAQAVKKYGDRNMLLVAAEDDRASADTVKELERIGGNDKYVRKIYRKGGHGTAIFAAKVGLEELLADFHSVNL